MIQSQDVVSTEVSFDDIEGFEATVEEAIEKAADEIAVTMDLIKKELEVSVEDETKEPMLMIEIVEEDTVDATDMLMIEPKPELILEEELEPTLEEKSPGFFPSLYNWMFPTTTEEENTKDITCRPTPR